jgi:hypothetical protein
MFPSWWLTDRDWTKQGGIAGRGFLIDFASWAERNGVDIRPATRQVISLQVIRNIIREDGIKLKPGDILIIRSGLIQAYNKCNTDEQRNALMRSPQTIGVEASEEMVRWLWGNRFAAVAGDAVAFEAQPYAQDFGKNLMISSDCRH